MEIVKHAEGAVFVDTVYNKRGLHMLLHILQFDL